MAGRTTDLTGRRVLVVEDEVIVAFSLECEIVDAGGEVVGPAYTLREAFELLAEPIDAAILDINISGEMVWPLAERLRAAGIPFLFASANSREPALAAAGFADVPRFDKPVVMSQLLNTLARLTATADGERIAS